MSDEFDPYYTWLGIPPEEQPADHYRLIGLRQFEENGDVISNALDQKMQFLRTLQVGKRSATSQRILNEISAAGGVLLDPKRKQAYDGELRAKAAAQQAEVQARTAAAKPIPRPMPAAAPVALPAAPRPVPMPAKPKVEFSPGPQVDFPAVNTSSRPSSSWMLPLFVGGGILALLILGVGVWGVSRSFNHGEKKIAASVTKHPVTLDKTTKPGVESPENVTKPGEVKPKPAIPSSENPAGENPPIPPEPIKPVKTKTPETVPGTKSPLASVGKEWWKNYDQIDRLMMLQFGTDAYAEFPDSASRSGLATPLSVEMWLRLHVEGDQPARILGTILGGEGVVPKGWGLIVRRVGEGDQAREQMYVEFWKPNNEYVHYPVSLLDSGSWHHLALVLEPSKPGKVFVDGKPLEFSEAKDVVSSQRNLVLGSETQPPGATFKAEVCGLRASEGVRYRQSFTPPSPLDMLPDEGTFATLDCRLLAPTAASPDKPYPWLYGVARFDDANKQMADFKPLRYGTAHQWQGGSRRPDNKLGWIGLDAVGGHPGGQAAQAAVRRWVAPAGGDLSIVGRFRHYHDMKAGDGIRGRIVSSRSGQAGEWKLLFQETETNIPNIKVEAGDTVDFAVDCNSDWACDAFAWVVDLKLVDAENRLVGTWNSAKDFRVLPPAAAARNDAAEKMTLAEPRRQKAVWLPLEDYGAALALHERPTKSSAHLVAQYVPTTAAGPNSNPTSPLVLKPAPTKPPSPFDDPAPAPTEVPGAKKAAPPDAAALAKAKAEVLQVFGDDLKGAKAPKQKQELAQKMLELVKDTTDGATKFALLEEVRRLAVEGHDTALALSAVASLGEQFEIDLFAHKVKLFEGLAAEGLTPAQRGEAISAACDFGYEALDADKFEALSAIVASARSMVVKATTAESKVEAKEFFDSYAKKQKLIDAIKKAEQTIATAPNEPGANQTLGLYYTFTRGDQKKGLPLLAKGTDQKLAAAAKLREQNVAKGVASSLEEADAWFDASGSVSADYKLDVQKLALECYSVLASSGTGLEKVKAEKRHSELAAAVAAAPVTKGSRPKASDFPEFSSGMVGRVLVNGRDAGALVTFQPGRQVNTAGLNEILDKSKASGLRVIVEGYVSCAVETQVLIYQQGQSGGPGQIVSVDGKPVNAVGGATGRSTQSQFMPLAPGEHLVQWAFDYVRTTEPSMRIFSRDRGEPILVRYTRQQAMAARKPATTAEVVLSN